MTQTMQTQMVAQPKTVMVPQKSMQQSMTMDYQDQPVERVRMVPTTQTVQRQVPEYNTTYTTVMEPQVTQVPETVMETQTTMVPRQVPQTHQTMVPQTTT